MSRNIILKLILCSVVIISGLALPVTPGMEDSSIQLPSESRAKTNEASQTYQYYTAQASTKIPICKGPCGRFGKKYDWCNVTDTEWDYCSSETKSNFVSKDFSVEYGPCKGPCYHKDREIFDDYWCEVYWGFEDRCINEKHNYIQAKTVYGLECVGACQKHNNMQHFWCFDTNRAQNYCAVPARVAVH